MNALLKIDASKNPDQLSIKFRCLVPTLEPPAMAGFAEKLSAELQEWDNVLVCVAKQHSLD